jgi:hypothetical protein
MKGKKRKPNNKYKSGGNNKESVFSEGLESKTMQINNQEMLTIQYKSK